MSQTSEAVIVLCKCQEGHKTFGIRAEKQGPKRWLLNWAFPIKDAAAKREGYDRASINGTIEFSEDYPGCPYCGGKGWVLCSCGHLSCLKEPFVCQWCGRESELSNYTGEESIQAGMDF